MNDDDADLIRPYLGAWEARCPDCDWTRRGWTRGEAEYRYAEHRDVAHEHGEVGP